MPEKIRNTDILILVTGLVGSGRSTFINDILGEKRMKVGDPGSTLTVTTEAEYAIINPPHKNYRLVIVDTPGFDDQNKTDTEVLNQISVWLHKYIPKGISRGGVIYLHDISDPRYHAVANADLTILRKSFYTEQAYRRIILATTKWARVDRKEGNARQGQLESRWQRLISGGSKVHQVKDSTDAWKIVNDLLSTLEKETELNIEKGLAELRKPRQNTREGMLARIIRIMESISRAKP